MNLKYIKKHIVCTILFTVIFTIVFSATIFKEYFFRPAIQNIFILPDGKNDISNASEILIEEITLDGEPINFYNLKLKKGWEIKDNKLLYAQEDNKVPLEIQTKNALNIEIKFLCHAWAGKISVMINDLSNTIDLYNSGLTTYSLKIENKEKVFDLFSNKTLLVMLYLVMNFYVEILLYLIRKKQSNIEFLLKKPKKVYLKSLLFTILCMPFEIYLLYINCEKENLVIEILLSFIFTLFIGLFIKKYNKKWKIHSFIKIFLGILVFFLLYQPYYPDSNIKIISTGKKNEASQATEIWINYIKVDGQLYDMSQNEGENWRYTEGSNDLYTSHTGETTINLKKYHRAEIDFICSSYSGLVSINNNGVEETIDLFSQKGKHISYIVENVKMYIPFQQKIILFISYGFLWIAILNIIETMKIYYQNMSNKNKKITVFVIFSFITTIAISNFKHYIMLDDWKLFVFWIIAILGNTLFSILIDEMKLKIYFENKNIFILAICNLFITFVIFFDRLFLQTGTFIYNKQIITFLLCYFAMFPIDYLTLYVFEWMASKKGKIRSNFKFSLLSISFCLVYTLIVITSSYNVLIQILKGEYAIILSFLVGLLSGSGIYFCFTQIQKITLYKEKSSRLGIVLTLECILLFIPILIILNPGCLTIDSFTGYREALQIEPLTDRNPAIYTLIERLLLSIFKNPSIITITQIIFFSSLMGWIGTYFYKKGYKPKTIFFIIGIFCLLPPNMINIITLWKDIPFCISTLWLTVYLAKLQEEQKNFFNKKSSFIVFPIAILSVSLFRHNGLIAGAFIILLLIGLSIKWRTIKSFICAVIVIVMIFFVKGPIYEYFNVQPLQTGSSTHLRALIYTKQNEGNLSDDLEEYLASYAPIEVLEELYSPYGTNMFSSSLGKSYDIPNKLAQKTLIQQLPIYIETFFNEPYMVIQDRLYGTDILWNAVRSVGNNYRYADKENMKLGEPYGIFRIETAFSELYYTFLDWTGKNIVLDTFFWRAGIYIAIYFIYFYFSIIHKNGIKWFICALPCIGHIISLILAMSWQDYRYVYFMFLCNIFFLLYTLNINKTSNIEEEDKK